MSSAQENIVIYQTEDGVTKINVHLEDETVWLTQAQLVELYQTSKSNVSEHIKHIFEEGELDEISVVRNFRTTAGDGKKYNTTHYNLDMIISLGYRVNLDNILSSTGEKLLTDAGRISHQQAMDKAIAEYRKYQIKTISSVEQAYLDTIKSLQKMVGKKGGGDE